MTIDDIRRLHAETLQGLPEFRRWGKFDRNCVGLLLAEIDKLRDAERAAAERMKARCVQEAEDAPLCCECGRGYLDCIAAIKALPLEEPK